MSSTPPSGWNIPPSDYSGAPSYPAGGPNGGGSGYGPPGYPTAGYPAPGQPLPGQGAPGGYGGWAPKPVRKPSGLALGPALAIIGYALMLVFWFISPMERPFRAPGSDITLSQYRVYVSIVRTGGIPSRFKIINPFGKFWLEYGLIALIVIAALALAGAILTAKLRIPAGIAVAVLGIVIALGHLYTLATSSSARALQTFRTSDHLIGNVTIWVWVGFFFLLVMVAGGVLTALQHGPRQPS